MKTNLFRALLKGFSLTSALFIFQACYGTPQDLNLDVKLEGQVVARFSGLPVKDIKVSVVNNVQYAWTDEQGKFSMYTEWNERLSLSFEDTDLEANGKFVKKDTTLLNPPAKVSLNIILEEQQ